jgi:hypothetical protein
LSTAVVRVRQPIEVLFAWIEEKQALNPDFPVLPEIAYIGSVTD